ncbi:MAG: hypothetical protein A3K77_01630 [Euryarchaeota archaeon RBG_13_31_8]|nr:MAG: hypothetical protein A3K77_01630 [Euryarchaeota archaeon RBG_13_31_8]
MKKIIKTLVCLQMIISIFYISIGASAGNTVIEHESYDENSPPEIPIINGTTHGTIGVEYNYTFLTTDPEGDDVYYYIKWEPGCPSVIWFGPYPSGQEITFSHSFTQRGTYSINCQAKDIYNATSDIGLLSVTMSREKAINKPFFNYLQNIFKDYPKILIILQRLLN